MIAIDEPAMSLTSQDFDYNANMMRYKNSIVYADVKPSKLVSDVAAVAAGTGYGRLQALVVTCHGIVQYEGGPFVALDLGTGIYLKDVKKHCYKWRGLIYQIYIQACGAARGKSGRAFCKELALKTGAYVYASDLDQKPNISQWTVAMKLGGSYIDDYEGAVYKFYPGGGSTTVQL
jgi:hypothetical protein